MPIFESPMVFTIPNHLKSSTCVRYFASSSLRTEDPTSYIAHSQLIFPVPLESNEQSSESINGKFSGK